MQAATLVFVPTANFNGVVTVTFSVTDNEGLSSAVTADAVITVTAVNDAPIAVASTSTGVEDASRIAVNLTGTDIDGTVETVTVTVLPTAAQGVLYLADGITPVVAGTAISAVQAATLVFVPTANFNGVVTVTFSVTDNQGLSSAVTADAVITVTAQNDLTATNDNAVTAAGKPLTASVAANDSTTSGGVPVYVKNSEALYGSVTVNTNGTYTYIPMGGYSGTDTFTYTVIDALSGERATRTVSLVVNTVTDVPTGVAAINEGVTTTIDVLANNSFPSGAVVNAVTQGLQGAVVINADGTISYTPRPDAIGIDTFSYSVSSGGTIETVAVKVNLVPNQAVYVGLTTTVNVLANNSFSAGTVVNAVTQGTQGVVVINPDGTISYTPRPDAVGVDTFSYSVSSGGAIEIVVVKLNLVRNQAVLGERSDTHEYQRTVSILPVHAEPALFVLFSVSDARSEMSLRSGLGVFQSDAVTTAELLTGLDSDNLFSAGTDVGVGGLSGRDFSPIQPLYRGTLDQPNALYIQHAVRHESLGLDQGLHVQAAVRNSQYESTARNIRINSLNTAVPGVTTLFDAFVLGAPNVPVVPAEGQDAVTRDPENIEQVNPSNSQPTEADTVNTLPAFRVVDIALTTTSDTTSAPRQRAALGFSSQLQRDAARIRPQTIVQTALRTMVM